MTGGLAFRIRLELAQLAQRHASHHTVAAQPIVIPLSEPVDYPVTIEGLAATTDIDLEHTRFRRYEFPLLPWSTEFPPLLYKHDPAQIAGRIESLDYDAEGRLRIRAYVDHPMARRCGAFSIRGTIVAYELRDTDNANFHALVPNAELTEISLTDTPANPQALVRHRYKAAPFAAYLDTIGKTSELMIRRVEIVQQQLAMLQQTWREHQHREQGAIAEFRGALRVEASAPVVGPRRPNEFSQLVEAINR
jgi:prohead serine protease